MTAPTPLIVDLKGLGDLLHALAESIAKLGDGVAHLIELGAHGYDTVVARRTRKRLLSLYGHILHYCTEYNEPVAGNLEAYLREEWFRERSEPSWGVVVDQVAIAADKVEELLAELRKERCTEFVLEDAYKEILKALQGRRKLFARLRQMRGVRKLEGAQLEEEFQNMSANDMFSRLRQDGPPQRAEEIKALRCAVDEFRQLRQKLLEAQDAFNAYLGDRDEPFP